MTTNPDEWIVAARFTKAHRLRAPDPIGRYTLCGHYLRPRDNIRPAPDLTRCRTCLRVLGEQ